MKRDFDVCVIGGGPAGLAAAIRTRWVKSYKALSCSTVIVEPGRLGGLTRWGPTRITGPSMRYEAGGLAEGLERDVRNFNIPVVKASARQIRFKGAQKIITLSNGKEIGALAVVIATGLRQLSNEEDFVGSDITIPSMGYEFLERLFRRLFEEQKPERLLVIGNEKTSNLRPLLSSLAGGRASPSIIYLLDSKNIPKSGHMRGDDVCLGRVVRFLGKGGLTAVRIMCGDKRSTIKCDHAIIDYNAFELSPSTSAELPPDLKREHNGFLAVDREMATNVSGIFCAGDITGLYASAGKAVAEGIIAGFSAYRYVHNIKFGDEPVLFAYRALDGPIKPGTRDLPTFSPSMRPVALAKTGEVAESLRSLGKALFGGCTPHRGIVVELAASMDGKSSFSEIATRFDLEKKSLLLCAEKLVEEKHITVEPVKMSLLSGKKRKR